MTIAAGLLLLALGPGEGPELKEKHGAALAARLWQEEAFLASVDARSNPETLGHYFTPADYKVLRGNPILGYWHVGSFRWEGRKVAWLGIERIGSKPRRIGARAWDVAAHHVLRRQGLAMDPAAPIRIRGACVAAVIDATKDEPMPGVLLEVRVESPEGVLRYRIAVGKRRVEHAMVAALDFLVSFSRQHGGPPPRALGRDD